MRLAIVSSAPPLDTYSVYSSFVDWILSRKRRLRPPGLYVVGVFGSQGQGKTYFSQAITSRLNTMLKPDEGQAIARSLDDYYLTKAQRYRPEFLALGYNPKGISNRGPAGTHDTAMLWNDLQAMERILKKSPRPLGGEGVGEGAILTFPSFDKQADDQAPKPFLVQGQVGVFILEGWFVGANTAVDPQKAEPGLKRSVAQALKNYKPIFDRLDALWAFEPPASLTDIIAQRTEQEETLRRQTGKIGMTPAQIRRFVEYFYEDSWQEGVTSPIPPRNAASFWATTDLQHRFIKIESRAEDR